MVAEGDRDKLSLMKKKKKNFDYMTSSVLMEHQKNLLASLHFKASLGPWMSKVEITLLAPFFCFLPTSQQHDLTIFLSPLIATFQGVL